MIIELDNKRKNKYPVQNISPSLHSNALENSKHGKEDVVEVRDAAVRAFPASPALSIVIHTETAITGKRTRCRIIFHVKICGCRNADVIKKHLASTE